MVSARHGRGPPRASHRGLPPGAPERVLDCLLMSAATPTPAGTPTCAGAASQVASDR
jgi:hypothetical protein